MQYDACMGLAKFNNYSEQPLYIGPGDGAVCPRHFRRNNFHYSCNTFVALEDTVEAFSLSDVLSRHPDQRLAAFLDAKIYHGLRQQTKNDYALLRSTHEEIKPFISSVMESTREAFDCRMMHGDYVFKSTDSFCVKTPEYFGIVHANFIDGRATIFADFPCDISLIRASHIGQWVRTHISSTDFDEGLTEWQLEETLPKHGVQTREEIRTVLHCIQTHCIKQMG